MVSHVRRNHGLAGRRQRLAARSLVDLDEAAARMGVCASTVKAWHHEGRIEGERLNDKGEHYYRIPEVVPRKKIGRPPKSKPSSETHPPCNSGGAV